MLIAIALGVIATLLVLWQGATGTRPPGERVAAEHTVDEPAAGPGARPSARPEPERPATPRSRVAPDLAEKHRMVGRTGDPSTATLRVIVTDEQGHLLGGVKVNVILIDFEHGEGQGHPLTADADGRVEMASLAPAKRDWAVVVGSLYRAGERLELIAGRVTEVQAVIPTGATVAGEVRHPETGPLSDVMLALQAKDSRDRLTTATDEAGRYRLTGVPPGVYGVSVKGAPLGRRPRHVGDLVVRGLGAMTADFVLCNVSLRGAVLDMETNQPLPGVRLVIHEPDFTDTTTDEHGEYRFLDLPTGDCRLSARKDGYESRSVDVRELKAGVTRYLDVALRRAAILHIHVTDAGGRPVAGEFRLFVTSSRKDQFRVQTARVVTDEKGYARYGQIAPGTYPCRSCMRTDDARRRGWRSCPATTPSASNWSRAPQSRALKSRDRGRSRCTTRVRTWLPVEPLGPDRILIRLSRVLLLIPYKTDAAVEHRPWGTIGLIVANVAVVLILGFPVPTYDSFWGPVEEPFVNSLVLDFGSFDPLTWITCSFVHGDWLHLVFNMIFLWIFGLIVEGLIGWRRFLPIYFGVAAVASGIVQIVMLGAEAGWAAGSSDAIFGLMAIAALWAPRNHASVFYWILVIVSTGEIRVLSLCYIFLAINVLFAAITGFAISTETIHLLGGLAGLVIGYAMLRWNKVDCGGWDFLSLRTDRPGRIVWREAAEGPASPVAPRDPRVAALVRVRDALGEDDGTAADAAYEAGQASAPGWVLRRSDFLNLIAALRSPGQAERSLVRMEEFIQAYPEGSEAVRLALIQRLLHAKRPARALEHLAALEAGSLTDTQRAAKANLEAQAAEAGGRSGLELE